MTQTQDALNVVRDIIFKIKMLAFLIREAIESWKTTVWDADLDASYCCSGKACLCGGVTIREVYEGMIKNDHRKR